MKNSKKKIEKLYSELFKIPGDDRYIIDSREIDELYEIMMEYTGIYNRKTREFLESEEWNDLARFITGAFWKWKIKIIKKKLKIIRYYEKYYG